MPRRLIDTHWSMRPFTQLERRIASRWFKQCTSGKLIQLRLRRGGDFYLVRNNVLPMRPRNRNPLNIPPGSGGGGMAA